MLLLSISLVSRRHNPRRAYSPCYQFSQLPTITIDLSPPKAINDRSGRLFRSCPSFFYFFVTILFIISSLAPAVSRPDLSSAERKDAMVYHQDRKGPLELFGWLTVAVTGNCPSDPLATKRESLRRTHGRAQKRPDRKSVRLSLSYARAPLFSPSQCFLEILIWYTPPAHVCTRTRCVVIYVYLPVFRWHLSVTRAAIGKQALPQEKERKNKLEQSFQLCISVFVRVRSLLFLSLSISLWLPNQEDGSPSCRDEWTATSERLSVWKDRSLRYVSTVGCTSWPFASNRLDVEVISTRNMSDGPCVRGVGGSLSKKIGGTC